MTVMQGTISSKVRTQAKLSPSRSLSSGRGCVSKRDGGMMSSSLILPLDFSPIENHDPSLRPEYKMVYLRECPFEIRFQEQAETEEEIGSFEALKVKVLVSHFSPVLDSVSSSNEAGMKQSKALQQGIEEQVLKKVKVELTSESDLFFHFVHEVDIKSFEEMKKEQRLMVTFDQYPSVLLQMLNSCVDEANTQLAVFVIHQNGSSRLDFIKNLEYKYVELMTLQCQRSDDETVREQIGYRYKSMKSKLELVENRLKEVSSMLKVKNPSLLLQMAKAKKRA